MANIPVWVLGRKGEKKSLFVEFSSVFICVILRHPYSNSGIWTLSPILQMKKLKFPEFGDFLVKERTISGSHLQCTCAYLLQGA